MTFPTTRTTLVLRLAEAGDEADWRQFLADYWGPVCRFAGRWGGLQPQDAEDVAAQTFLALVADRLLIRWVAQRGAKLRTLLCAVARNIISNRTRLAQGRARLLHQTLEGADLAALLAAGEGAPGQDPFYASWADELVHRAVDELLVECHERGQGDCFRVFYGRLCEQMTMPQIAATLGIKTVSAENCYKFTRNRIGTLLEDQLRAHVGRYCIAEDEAREFDEEWRQLGEYLLAQGGIETAVRNACGGSEADQFQARKAEGIRLALAQLPPRDAPRPG